MGMLQSLVASDQVATGNRPELGHLVGGNFSRMNTRKDNGERILGKVLAKGFQETCSSHDANRCSSRAKIAAQPLYEIPRRRLVNCLADQNKVVVRAVKRPLG